MSEPLAILPIFSAIGVQIGTAAVERLPDGFRITFGANFTMISGDTLVIRSAELRMASP